LLELMSAIILLSIAFVRVRARDYRSSYREVKERSSKMRLNMLDLLMAKKFVEAIFLHYHKLFIDEPRIIAVSIPNSEFNDRIVSLRASPCPSSF